MSRNEKRPYCEVKSVADHIVDALRPYCARIEIAGSLRRQRPLIGDIEIVALPKRRCDLFGQAVKGAKTSLDQFLEDKVEFQKNGHKYKQFIYGRFSVDLFLPETPAHWGAIYMLRTGSHEFNMWLMHQRAEAASVMFRDGRVYKMGVLCDTPEEKAIFDLLWMDEVPPKARDDGRWLAYVK